MNKLLLLLFLGFLISAGIPQNGYRTVTTSSFDEGERLTYRVHYGFITAGEATMVVDDKIHELNSRACYKIDVFGRTSGIADKIFGVNNNWGTFLDTAAIVPHKFYRYIEEGNYRKNEVVNFDQLSKKALVNKLEKKSRKVKEVIEYDTPKNVQDMVSGYYYLRTLDYKKLKEGQIIKVNAFFDEEVYDFKVRFVGREKIDTKLGIINAVVLQPIMPETKIFSGPDPIKVWISDDTNKIPLKIKASMVVGSVEIDIKDFKQGKR